jgi:hypothetical protein
MSTEEWTRLVQRVDHLIIELRNARDETKRWRIRASELERLPLRDERSLVMDEQAKDRELDKLRRERKKVIAAVMKITDELEKAQITVVEQKSE